MPNVFHAHRGSAPLGRRQRLGLFFLLAAALLPLLGAAQSVTTVPTTTAVGSSATVSVPVTIGTAGTVNSIVAVTAGAANKDFSIATGGTCTTGTAYNVGDPCTVTVGFAPRYPGRRSGAVRLLDSNGNLLAQALVGGLASGPLPALKPGRIDTVAGSAGWTYNGDGVDANSAQIFTPKAGVYDGSGNLYIADTGNNRIRRVDNTSNLISTYAGTGSSSFSGDGGAATAAQISAPSGMVLDGAGNLYFSDYQNSAVRRIDAVSGIITTVAGIGLHPGYSNDGHAATTAMLNLPEGLAFDAAGNLYIADSGNNRIRKVDTSGNITTVAGNGTSGFSGDNAAATSATLNGPTGVFVLDDGTIYIADTANQRIRFINATNQNIYTVIGNGVQQYGGDGGPPTSASLNNPASVALDAGGDIFVTDAGNNRVRMLNVKTGNMETITGTDSETFSGDGGPADQATHYGPFGLFFSPAGDIVLTDMFHMRVRRISATSLLLSYPVMRVGKKSTPKPAFLTNYGSTTLTLNTPVYNQSALDTATTTCFGSSAVTMTSSSLCQLGVVFAPTVVGSAVTGTLSLPSNAANVTPLITLTGQVLNVNPTSVAVAVLAPSTNPSILGDAVTFQAAVTSDDTGRTGDVTFTVDGNTSCSTVTLSSSGTANCTVSGLALGTHTVIASYSGDAQNASSTSPNYSQVVKQRATLALTTSASPAVVTSTVTFTLTATAANGTPTGTITFLDGTTALGTAPLSGSGTATYSTANLSIGTHSITAQYSGDSANVSGTSAVLSQVIRQGNTSTTVSSSNANAPVGTTVVLTAAVTSLDGLTPTGTVVFRTTGGTLGSATVQSNGTATFSWVNPAAGTYRITATYTGDTNDALSNSAVLVQTVNRLNTNTTLTTNTATLSAGATLHLAAQVVIAPGNTAYGTISGTVTFADNGNALAAVALASDGTASYDSSGLTVGAHTLTATYSGDSNYNTSSGNTAETVVQTASTITVTPAASTVLAGNPAVLVATVGSSTGTPTGAVTFNEGSTVIGTVALTNGTARLSTTTLSVGTHTLTATYTGNSNYLPVTSTPVTVQVNLARTSVALTGPAAPVTVTNTASFQAALTTEGVAPTGTLTLYDGATAIATQTLTSSLNYSFSLTTLTVGTHTLTATYSGDRNSATSTSAAVTVTVVKATTATALTTSLTPAVLGNSVTFSAAVTSPVANLTGTVDLLEGTQVLGSATLTNGTAVIVLNTLSFGDHTLVARYNGDGQHNTSLSTSLAQRIIEPSSVTLASSLNPSVSGNNLTFTATVPGAAGMTPTGTVTFTDGTTTLAGVALNSAGVATLQIATLAVGSHPITASYAGDTNFTRSTAGLVQVVKLSNTSITTTVSADPVTYGTAVALTGTVTTDGGIATGSVQFTENGITVGAATLNPSGVAVWSTTALTPGRHTILASYLGDGKATPATSAPVSFLVRQQTSLALAATANPALTLDHIVVTATLANQNAANATGPVTFYEGATVLGTAALDNSGHAQLDVAPLSAGTHTLTASYPGDDADFPATAGSYAAVVNLRATHTTVSANNTSLTDPQQVTLTVVVQANLYSPVAQPTGSVALYNNNAVVGTALIDGNGVASFTTRLQVGQSGSFVARYVGDASYAASTSTATAVSPGVAAQFSLTLSSQAVNVAAAQHSSLTLTVASMQGFSDTLKFGCVGLPYAATCTFTDKDGKVSTGMALVSGGSGTLQVTVDTGNPLGSGAQTAAVRPAITHPAITGREATGAVLCLLPAGLLLCGNVRRRRNWKLLLLVLLGIAGTTGLTGCGGLQMSSTPAGTYTFQVTAVGQNTGVAQSQTVTLTVGK